MEFPEVYLERISYVDLKALFEEMRSSGEYEEKILRVAAAEYVEYNCRRNGYLWYISYILDKRYNASAIVEW